LKQSRSTILCYVTDRRTLPAPAAGSAADALLERIRRAADAGTNWIQLREKNLEGAALANLARAAIGALRNSGGQRETARLLINDRVDVAWAAGAGGVHLGESALPVAEVARARKVRGDRDFLIGASCHSAEAARRAEGDGADYVLFGPVFDTPSKAAFGPPQGLLRLAEVCAALEIPVLAIGGIKAETAAACLEAGAAGLAAIRLFQDAADLRATVARLRSIPR